MFIAIATLMMVRVMRLPNVNVLEDRSLLKRRTVIGLVVLLTLVPSVFLAIQLVQKEWFDANSARFVREVLRTRPNLLVVSQETDFKARQLQVNVVGDRLPDAEIKVLEARLSDYGLANVSLTLVQSGQVMPDMSLIKKDLINAFLQTNRSDIAERETRIAALQAQLQAAQNSAATQLPLSAIYRELQSQFPQALLLNVATGLRSVAAVGDQAPLKTAVQRPLLLVTLQLRDALSDAEQERLRLGLQTRAGLADLQDVQLDVTVVPRPVAPKRKR